MKNSGSTQGAIMLMGFPVAILEATKQTGTAVHFFFFNIKSVVQQSSIVKLP